MWGLSFEDMAKKAAELQEQAAHAAESLAQTPTGFVSPRGLGLFNLDGIQQEEEKAKAQNALPPRPPCDERSVEGGSAMANGLSMMFSAGASSLSSSLTSPTKSSIGKLQVPKNNNEKSAAKTSQTTYEKPMYLERMETPPVASMNRDGDNDDLDGNTGDGGDGWGDDHDDGLDDISEHDEPKPDAVAQPLETKQESEKRVLQSKEHESESQEPLSDEVVASVATHEQENPVIAPEPSQPIAEVSEQLSTTVEEPLPTTEQLPLAADEGLQVEVRNELQKQESDRSPSSKSVPDEVLEGFSLQLQRLEENFQAERTELLQQHSVELEQLKASFTHSECDEQKRLLEESYKKRLHQMEDNLHEVSRKNEGYRLKLDMLQREVDGTKKLLQDRDGDMGKTHESHNCTLRDLTEKLQTAQLKASQYELDIKRLKENLDTTNKDMKSLQAQHTELKGRMKSLALELKERRQECRQLKTQVDSHVNNYERLQTEADSLHLQLSNQGLNSSEKEEELEQLRSSLMDAQEGIKKLEKALKEQEERSEKVLSDYKKKAQNSLALSNARAAAAVQAKEEAELEARSARSTADSAMDKAVQAELSAKKEVAESRHLLREMENEKSKAIAESGNSRARLLECETKLRNVELLLKESASDKDRTTEKLQHATSALTHEESRRAAIETDLEDTKLKESGLRSDLSTVREELQQLRKSLAAAQAAAPPAPECSDVKSSIKAPSPTSTSGNDSTNHSLVDETVAMLQRELKEARSSNDELKEALGNLLAENDRNKRSFSSSDPVTESDTLQSAPKRLQSRDADSTPLFYAIEKQAELKTARDEITRLANLLSFVQSEKSEAEEAMILMKQRMEEAENRMKRYQKFGRASENGGTGGDNINHANNGSDSGLVNIEYLKNIMLRYLNAHTVKERKSLVPAIGAVLELTPDELHSALLNVEQGASLSGVGSSIFETLSTKLGGQL